jgi:hypothetical protein
MWREMIGSASQRLMELEGRARTAADYGGALASALKICRNDPLSVDGGSGQCSSKPTAPMRDTTYLPPAQSR